MSQIICSWELFATSVLSVQTDFIHIVALLKFILLEIKSEKSY